MVKFTDVPTDELLKGMAEEFKKGGKNIPPSWHSFVKTGAGKERPPVSNDWWYIRTASVVRRVALLGPIGVSKLRVHYGNNKNRGHKPEKFYRGSGNILRKILQQLEKQGYIKHIIKGVHKGRSVTPVGLKFMNSVANRVAKK